jgi:hypothetical protein
MVDSTHEFYKLTRDLWAEALEALPEHDRKLISIPSPSIATCPATTDPQKPALRVLHQVEALKMKCQDKRWSFLFRGKKVVVRDVLEKITEWIKTYQDVADWIVGLDVSGHASTIWACVKFFVEVRKISILPL